MISCSTSSTNCLLSSTIYRCFETTLELEWNYAFYSWKTLNNSDLNDVTDPRFSVKKWFAACGCSFLRAQKNWFCYLRIVFLHLNKIFVFSKFCCYLNDKSATYLAMRTREINSLSADRQIKFVTSLIKQ